MRIAITQRYRRIEKEGEFKESFFIAKPFEDIFEKLDMLLIPICSTTKKEEVVELCDGLIITGRDIDMHPKYYGEKKIEKTNLSPYYDKEDELDLTLIKAFHKENKPILGICAGIQSINVCFGGTLYQDIPNHTSKEEKKMHSIQLETGSFLESCYKTNKIEVNSFHHQAIHKVAENFRTTAVSEDGIIEAIEYKNIVGVQWHPEIMQDMQFFKNYVQQYYVKQ